MTTITTADSELLEEQSAPADGRPSLIDRLRAWRPRPLHASVVVTGVVALTSFEMSFAALHDLSVRNLVAPALAANVPIAIDGLVIGSIIATATFPRRSSAWWYATALFVFWTLVSVAGNIEYAREIGGSPVSLSLYAGMPLTMLFAVHLTLMLFGRGRDRTRAAEQVPAAQEDRAPAMQEHHALVTLDHYAPATPNHQPNHHAPITPDNHAPATPNHHAPATPDNHAPATPNHHAPVTPNNHTPPTPEEHNQVAEEDWDHTATQDQAADDDSAPQDEHVVPTRGAAILKNTDPLPGAAKKLPTSAPPGPAASPRITPTFATNGAGGKAQTNPL